jgi:hypothetical protein
MHKIWGASVRTACSPSSSFDELCGEAAPEPHCYWCNKNRFIGHLLHTCVTSTQLSSRPSFSVGPHLQASLRGAVDEQPVVMLTHILQVHC